MEYIFACLGLLILMVAGDALVRGAVNLALRLGIPALIVSLTIVALGTSAPELVVAIGSVLDGAPGLALGNVVGSNTANVLLVIGLPALLFGLATGDHDTRASFAQMIFATLLFIGLALLGPITLGGGLIMLGVLAVILVHQIRVARTHRRALATAVEEESALVEGADASMPHWKIAAYLIAGLIGLPVGAHLLVENAVVIATRLGVSETVIGLTLVAVGTSLPELATTLIAAMRRQADVALGNVIGSNLFNLLGIAGAAALFGTLPVDPNFLRFDLWVMLGASLALAPFVLWHLNISRMIGGLFTALYALYIVLILI